MVEISSPDKNNGIVTRLMLNQLIDRYDIYIRNLSFPSFCFSCYAFGDNLHVIPVFLPET